MALHWVATLFCCLLADTKENGKTFVIGLEGIYGKELKGHQLHTKHRCLGGSCMSPTL